MHVFTDLSGRVWELEINLRSLQLVRKALDVDLVLLMADDLQLLKRLCADVCLAGDILVLVCQDQFERHGVDADGFCRGLGGEPMEQAQLALIEAIIDFFPPGARRNALKRLVAKAREVGAKMQDLAVSQVNQLVDTIDSDSEARRLTGCAGSLPAFVASTPDITACGSSTSWPEAA